MTNKKMRLPKEGIYVRNDGRDDSKLIDTNDVEGHGLPVTPPPSFGTKVPGHGGENIPSPVDDDDVEGHKR